MPVTAHPSTPISTLGSFAAAARGYTHTFAVGEGPGQFATRLRRLTMAELESVDYPARLVPPAIPDAKPDAPYGERFNVDDPVYVKASVRALMRKFADLLHLAVEGGVPNEEPASLPAVTTPAQPQNAGAGASGEDSGEDAGAPDATDRRVRWMEVNLPVPVRNALLSAIYEISQNEAIRLAGFISPAA